MQSTLLGIAGSHSEQDENSNQLSTCCEPVIPRNDLLSSMQDRFECCGEQRKERLRRRERVSYTCCDPVEFMNIGNIHVMRRSLNSLLEDCQDIVMGLACSLDGMDEWFGHISLVLQAAVRVSKLMHIEGRSTLVRGIRAHVSVCVRAHVSVYIDIYGVV